MLFLLIVALLCTGAMAQQSPQVRKPATKAPSNFKSTIPAHIGALVVFEFKGSKGTVLINDHPVCKTQKKCMGEIPTGTYTVRLQNEGYLDSVFQIHVPNGSNYYPTALVEKPGILSITALDQKSRETMEARVYIDEKELGVTPWSGPVFKEAKTVGIRMPGYQEQLIKERPPKRKEISVQALMVPTDIKAMELLSDGCFDMGSESGKKDEMPVHEVCISSFYIDPYEVSQSQFKKVMGQDPSFFANCGKDCPVESVTWKQALTYCEKLGKRLPTEAEWEYAARGGSGSKWGCGMMSTCIGGVAWMGSNSDGKPHPVGKKSPNNWGLYDMSGNVAEWTADYYGHTYYKFSPKQDPKGANGGDSRVVRGGSYFDKDTYMLPSVRGGFDPNFRETTIGFRCAMDLKYSKLAPK